MGISFQSESQRQQLWSSELLSGGCVSSLTTIKRRYFAFFGCFRSLSLQVAKKKNTTFSFLNSIAVGTWTAGTLQRTARGTHAGHEQKGPAVRFVSNKACAILLGEKD